MDLEKPELWEIPDSWQWSKISELGAVVSGGTPSTKEPAFWGGEVNWITPADLSGYSEKFISKGAKSLTQKGLANSSAKLMPKGSVHFSSRAPVGYVVISKEDMSTNQGFKSIVPTKGGFNEFLYYYLKGAKRLAEERASGTTFKEISGKAFSELPIPLAPFNEQQRIIAKLEELFSELDKGIESFKTAREQLAVYRQAVLKHAFEGKLTEEWRKKHADKLDPAETLLEKIKVERERRYRQQLDDWKEVVKAWEAGGKEGKKPTKPGKPKELPPLTEEELSELPELPESWIWEKLSWMTLGVDYGTSAKSHEAGKVPVLRMGNIQKFRFDWSDLAFSDDEDEINKYRLKKGDVLFNRTNSPELVGKTAIYQGEQEAIFAGYLIRVNQIPNIVDPKFLNYFLNSVVAKSQGNKVKTDGVNQSNINANKLIQYPFPYCSLNEQEEVVREMESRLSTAERLEQDIEDGLKQAEALWQSLLKKAFEGRLVPQDVNDEPASVLLERIKTEKAKLKKKNRKQKKVTA